MRLTPSAILAEHAHRPWPLPQGPWIQRQTWNDFLFCHWPVDAAEVRRLVPGALPLDLWDGRAWLGIIPFHMTGVTLRGLPDLPRFSAFAELNVRTYVRIGDRAGVYFLSLEAHNRLAVALARRWYGLPYMLADMAWSRSGSGAIDFRSVRRQPGAPAARYEATYTWTDEVVDVQPGSFEHWLVERYALYVVDRRDQVWVGHVHHHPWPIRRATIAIRENTLAESHGLTLPDRDPHVLYAPGVDVVVWQPTRVPGDR